jgi:hypothetical protein
MGSEDNDRERVSDIIKRLLNRAVNAEIIKEKPNLYYDAAYQIERLHAEIEKLHREAAIRIDQIEREQEAHLETIADYNWAAVENEKLRLALLPFARIAADYEDWETEKITMIVLLYHLRAAAAAIRESGE